MLTSSNPPSHLLEVGKQTHEFFNCHVDAHGRKNYSLKPMDQYAAEHRTNEQPSKQYFKQTRLNDIIMEYSFSKKNAKQSDIDKGMSSSRAARLSIDRILLITRNGASQSVRRLC
jgi:dual specificity protein kinase YAK1